VKKIESRYGLMPEVIEKLLLPYKIDLSLYDQIDNKEFIDHIDRWGKGLNLK
jgi:hypothetical protein